MDAFSNGQPNLHIETPDDALCHGLLELDDPMNEDTPAPDLTVGSTVRKGITYLGFLKPFKVMKTPHLHLQAIYSELKEPNVNSVFSGISHATYGEIEATFAEASPSWILNKFYTRPVECERPSHDTENVSINPLILLYWQNLRIPSDGSFIDVPPDAWYAKSVENLRERGIVKGRAPGFFVPDDPVTRAELLKMTVMAIGTTCGASQASLRSCRESDGLPWYSGCLAADNENSAGGIYRKIAFWQSQMDCREDQYGGCCTEGDCGPADNRNATRGDAARILAIAADPRYWPAEGPIPNERGFADDIDPFLGQVANYLHARDILEGYSEDGTVKMKPEKNINRAEVAKMISKGIDDGYFRCHAGRN